MGPSTKFQLISLFVVSVFTVRVSSSFPSKVDVRNPRLNRTTGRFMKIGGTTFQTIRSSNGNNHLVGITNGKSTGIGGILGAKESKAFGDSLRQGLRKVIPLASNVKHNNRISSTGKTLIRNNNFNSRQIQINQHGNSMRKGTGTGIVGNILKVGANAVNKMGNMQRNFAGQSTSGNRGRLNNVASKNGVGSANTQSGSATRVQQLSRSSNTNVQSKTPANNGGIHGKNTVRVSQAGNVRHSIKNVNQNTRQLRGQSLSARRGSGNTRGVSSTSTKGRIGSVRSSSGRTVSSPGSSNGRIAGVATNQNQNGVSWNNNAVNKRGSLLRKRISEGNVLRNSRNFNRNSGQSARQSQRFGNQQSGRFNAGQNRMTRISQRGGGHHPFQVSSGMQSNIRRRTGGLARGISNNGKRVVVQNGRRIIVSPSRSSLYQKRQETRQQQSRRQEIIDGDPVEGLENMDIDNIIGLASKIASVKLANSIISSFNGQEGTQQLSRFLIDSELDIVPELIVPVPKQAEQASTRRIVTMTRPASAVKQLQSPPVAKNQVTVASRGYGTPVLLQSNGDIQFSRVDQTGKEISSVTISKGKSKQIKKGNKVNAKSKTKPGNGTGTGTTPAGGASKQVPGEELEMEMETEGLSTTTIAATTKTKKPLLPPTTTVANSVIVS
ncbi:uncharacterized protein LOC110441662 [Mizuhopecten yessoensis]|uniref:Uncharacterized protein n=1 Tax=Mizuhopecten yessoensis TaxID=6573 RepID=A0A210PJ74_MIZYE|nr:uncharacterized protein LOC110441662 [Mizuhopecten yessoensis]OWF36466.1 hypothetical protein KP79_PYT22851 [Mizuhopecten yessoensis]